MSERTLTYYQKLISEISGVENPKVIRMIEDALRDESPDGCLDSWSRAMFEENISVLMSIINTKENVR